MHAPSMQAQETVDPCPAADWSKADPMAYLAPFLTLIKASDVSGPVTGAAAVAIQTILDHEFICEDEGQAKEQMLVCGPLTPG